MSASPYPYDTLFVESEAAAAAPPGAPIPTDEQVRRWNEEGVSTTLELYEHAG